MRTQTKHSQLTTGHLKSRETYGTVGRWDRSASALQEEERAFSGKILYEMVDIPRQVAAWRKGAEEDWPVACELVERGRLRHGLFFAHLAIEKLLKAHVCRRTEDLAPRIHNLVRLAEQAGLRPSAEQLDVLAEMNQFHDEPVSHRGAVPGESRAAQ